MQKTALLPLICAVTCLLASGQEPPPPAEPGAGGAPGGGAAGGRTAPTPEPRPYEKVVTKDFSTKDGLFKVHKSRDRTLYEIPKREFGKEMLLVSTIRRTTIGNGYGGGMLAQRVVRWELQERKVLLRVVDYSVTASEGDPIAQAVRDSNENAIIMAFNIEAFNKEQEPVIDVTRLFASDVPELSARTRLRARSLDASRSFVERVAAFPTNIEVDATHTYVAAEQTPGMGGAPAPTPSPFGAAGIRGSSGTVVLHHSMVKLPEKPMMPRLFDDRVGYFSTATTDYSRPEHKALRRTFIARWRLEKKDPAAAVSEPVKPIAFYVDPATPSRLVEWVKKGIEDWKPAFEAAGFRNGIVAREAPSKQEDPDWSPEDARYSVIRWLPSTIENAMGPHISDPRTGEILEADIQIYHNVQNLAGAWYFLQAGPNDPRARKLPLSDALMGRLIEYVVAHEVGHSLGFQHNFKASSLYPLEKIRDREWVKKMGHVPTLMDYSRFNYVAQPEDKIDPDDLIPEIGPYDIWATRWGYMSVAGAKTPDEEKPALDEMCREQEKSPWLRFSTAKANGADYGEQSEAVGDADAVKATGLGLKNLARVAGYLLKATEEKGEDWDRLEEVYSRLVGQWRLELSHVATIVGSFETRQVHGGQAGVKFTPTPRARQAEAVDFLMKNAFVVPKWMLDPQVLRRIEADGALARFKQAQQMILTSLLATPRFTRLVEQEAALGARAYAPADMLADVRKGLFAELAAPQVKVDAFRRNAQRVFLDIAGERLNGRAPATDDLRALLRAQVRSIGAGAAAAAAKAADAVTRAHLEDVKDQAAKILDPKLARAEPAAAAAGRTGRPGAEENCWPDYAIRPERE